MCAEEFEAEVHREFDRFRGKLAGFIEGYGLPERQERGIVSMMKNLSYDAEAMVKAAGKTPEDQQ